MYDKKTFACSRNKLIEGLDNIATYGRLIDG